MEYSSLLLVISFLFLHNIYIVFLGITISLYILNNEFIDRLINKISKHNNKNYRETKELKQKNLEKEISIKEECIISLVDRIEESGFIPSQEEDDASNVA